jgi:hypothetical protein
MSDIERDYLSTLRQGLTDIADQAGTADLYDRSLNASRRLGRRRAILVSAVVVACVLAVAPFVVRTANERHLPMPATSQPAPSPSSSLLAGPLPDPTAGTASAPYYIAVAPGGSAADVYDAATGQSPGRVVAPDEMVNGVDYPTTFTAVAAAGDDRTFMLAARPMVDNPVGSSVWPSVWFFELRLASDGTPGQLVPRSFPYQRLGYDGPWALDLSSMALSADGSELAISTNRLAAVGSDGPADIEVVSLATGATRTWTTSVPVELATLSWAGDTSLAFLCGGAVCLLDTSRPGTKLDATLSHPVISASTAYQGLANMQWPRITPDGSTIYVGMNGPGAGIEALVAFSVRTGRPDHVVIPARDTGGDICTALWSDPAGAHLVAACGWSSLTGTVDDGVFTPGPTLRPAALESMSDSNGDLIAW